MVTIIIPVYNSQETIEETLKSIEEQNFKELEVIIVDDGSTDGTLEICDLFKDKFKIFQMFKQKNEGAGSARNKGIKNAKGDFIMFCDSDDILPKNSINTLYENIIQENSDLVVGSYVDIELEENKRKIVRVNNLKNDFINDIELIHNKYIELYNNNSIQAPWGKLYKKEVIIENNTFFKNYRRCQDIVFNIEYFNCINSLKIISDQVYMYNIPKDKYKYLKKIPKDMFSILKNVNKHIIYITKNWRNSNDIKRMINRQMILDADFCIRLSMNSVWSLTRKEEKKYFKEISNDNFLKECLMIKQKELGVEIRRVLLKLKLFNTLTLINKIVNFVNVLKFNKK